MKREGGRGREGEVGREGGREKEREEKNIKKCAKKIDTWNRK